MTLLTHSSNWETVRTDVWVKRGKANRLSLSRVVLFSSLRWSHRIRLSDLDQNFSPSSPMRVLLGMLFFLGLVKICGYPHRHFDRRHTAPWNWS